MRRPLVAGNWKMNGSRESISKLLEAILRGLDAGGRGEILVCAPYPYIALVERALTGSSLAWGAQNLSQHAGGAFTGEVSADMLLDFGCSHVLVGHSERRALYGEDDQTVAEKFSAALRVGLKPILCVGETLEQREQGETESVVVRQVRAVLERDGAGALADAVLAYEPVWAIGTGLTATPEQAQAVHRCLRAEVARASSEVAEHLRILYGGSVKANNAAQLFSMADIDGGLIGGAALDAAEFLSICHAAN